MATLSVPLTHELESFIEYQVKRGRAANKAQVVRAALHLLAEEEAVAAVLKAEREPTLSGDIDKLAKKIA